MIKGNFLGAAIVAIIYTVYILINPGAVKSKPTLIMTLVVLNALTIVLMSFAFKNNFMGNKKIPAGTVHKLPPDLKKTLASDKEALAVWQNLTPLARNEWICWVTFVKKAETRKQHVHRVRTELKQGMRRPCCWLGCIHRTDKKISPSVQGILNRRSKKYK